MSVKNDSKNDTHTKRATQFKSISDDDLNVSSKFLPDAEDLKLNMIPEIVNKLSKSSSTRQITSIESQIKNNLDILSALE
jgi:hypothetical protein